MTNIVVLACVLALGCSSNSEPSGPPGKGRVVVAITIDWEGMAISLDSLDAIGRFRKAIDPAPVTHFVSAGYFTKERPDPKALETLTDEVRPGDEIAVHIHAWQSLAKASGVEPKLSPSFLSGTDKLLQSEGDVGFDVDLDAYSVDELRALLVTSRKLLEPTKLPISKSFRAAGYLGTPKVMEALRAEGFTIDSSATDYRQLDERKDALPGRIRALWPNVETTTQPFVIPGNPPVLEMPIAAFVEYATADEITGILKAAYARLAKSPDKDVIVVLGFHQETATEFVGRLVEAFKTARANKAIAKSLEFATIESAAARGR